MPLYSLTTPPIGGPRSHSYAPRTTVRRCSNDRRRSPWGPGHPGAKLPPTHLPAVPSGRQSALRGPLRIGLYWLLFASGASRQCNPAGRGKLPLLKGSSSRRQPGFYCYLAQTPLRLRSHSFAKNRKAHLHGSRQYLPLSAFSRRNRLFRWKFSFSHADIPVHLEKPTC